MTWHIDQEFLETRAVDSDAPSGESALPGIILRVTAKTSRTHDAPRKSRPDSEPPEIVRVEWTYYTLDGHPESMVCRGGDIDEGALLSIVAVDQWVTQPVRGAP